MNAPQPVPGPIARRIAENQPKPPAKPAWMKRLTAKDLTGRVLA